MCGIFGVTIKDKNKYTEKDAKEIAEILLKLSESRGKEAAGMAIKSKRSINVLKMPVSASCFLKSGQYKKFSANAFSREGGADKDGFLTVIGHSRLTTHGTENLNRNNQPVIKENAACVHNGIITNDKQLWEKFPTIKREFEVDTEVLIGLLQLFFSETGSIVFAIQKTFEEIEGSASLAILFNNNRCLLLATNTGSLYIYDDPAKNIFLFASERYILEQLIGKIKGIDFFKQEFIQQILPGKAMLIDVQTLENNEFSFLDKTRSVEIPVVSHDKTEFVDYSNEQNAASFLDAPTIADNFFLRPEIKKIMNENWSRLYSVETLKRCAKCLLPETMTFIDFDDQGVCNYCRNYEKIQVKGTEALEKAVSKYRRSDGKPDCLITFSGGRDSSYGLHYFKKILKMNPIAFTYDWGMMTDLGRRNEARMCGKLGVEHIIISADIRKKRCNIRKNLEAWLKKPELGTVPLLMAGDKDLLYYTNWLRKKTNVRLVVDFYAGRFEEDLFKVGFTGLQMNSAQPYQNLSLIDKIKLSKYYATQYILNPRYINSSVFDTTFAYLNAVFFHWDSLRLFDYIKWNEKEILSIIINEYNWEKEQDTIATWRVDDGTAAFYNYIYMAVAGITEFDTFRSVQIREGQISRKEAYNLIKEENRPRYESIEWYCRTVGVDCNKAINRINSISKLYKL